MKPEPIVRIQDLVGLINALYPPSLAEDWDNVGLQVGDPTATVERLMVSLDPTEATLDAALKAGAQALVSHHPLIFRPYKTLVPGDETGRILFRAVREGIAVISAHTNLDRAADGLNDWLAARLGVGNPRPLSAGGEGGLLKLVVFVPAGYENRVAEAMYGAGGGRIGRYDKCSFRTAGIGTFRAGPGTDPFLGREGVVETVREVRLEIVLPKEQVGKVVAKMLKAHPYEEVAYDLIPLANSRPATGLGRIGRLAAPVSLATFADQIKQALDTPALRLVGDPGRQVVKVALCGGSGASLLREAARQGADLLVTGDVKYHEARAAESLGVALVDAGHFATERLMVGELASRLKAEAETRGIKITVIEAKGEADPFRMV
ncbi:MAG: Nif3-like dinuclear metal center hexameric protein [Desulfuromonadaceae bacterium GWC2_58_13]|nr:MAG: Nif3-like dinuclear metal center hexameric protein [Desulfuromonadaceae bacterium GWC2_58_13]